MGSNGDNEIILGGHAGIGFVRASDIQVNPDDDPMRNYFSSNGECLKLKDMISGHLGHPVNPVDRINRRPNGELNLISFRDLAANSILEWAHKSQVRKAPWIGFDQVSRSQPHSIEYKVDFTIGSENSSGDFDYYVLMIFKIGNRFRVTIQRKSSALSAPFGIISSDPSTVWMREVGINEALYTEKQLKMRFR